MPPTGSSARQNVDDQSMLPQRLVQLVPFFAAGFLFLLLMVGVISPRLHLTGDEPHYLLATHSLYYDQDVDLENNYRNGDADAWYPGLGSGPHAFDYKNDGKLYSVHGIGLPLLLLPAYAVLHSRPVSAARLVLVLVAALSSHQVFGLVLDLWKRRELAWCAWGIATLTTPPLFLSSQVFPDLPAALLVVVAIRQLVRVPTRRSTLLVGLMISALPWFHVRYVVLSAPIFCLTLLRVIRSPKRARLILLLTLPAVIGGLAYLWTYWTWYGNPLQNAQFPTFPWCTASIPLVLRRLVWMFWDRELGLIPIAPVFILSLSGLAAAVTRRKRAVLEALIILFAYLVPTAWASQGACGPGFSFPWRLMVPIIAPLVLLVISWAAEHTGTLYVTLGALALSASISVLASYNPASLYSNWRGVTVVPGWRRIQWLFPGASYLTVRKEPAWRGRWHTGRLIDEQGGGDGGQVVYAQPSEDEPGFLSWGLWSGAMPGNYRVRFELKTQAVPGDAVLAGISVVTDGMAINIASRDLYASDFAQDGEYAFYTLEFPVTIPIVPEALVYYTGKAPLWVRSITFEQVSLKTPSLGYWPAAVLSLAAILIGAAPGLSRRFWTRGQTERSDL